MKIVIDLDWTICSLRKNSEDYSEVTVNEWAREYIKQLKDKWHYIIIQTARHMETCKGNLWLINVKVWQKTMNWLDENNILYDEIFFWKPNADIYIDDKASLYMWWHNMKDLESYNENKINIVIPMAWAWSRFKKEWFELPKPLIDVNGKTMVEWAVDSFDFLKEKYDLNFIFIVLNDHINKYNIDSFLKEKYNWCVVVWIDSITRWQAETVLKSKDYINWLEKLIIYNADTYSKYDLKDFPIDDKSIDWIIPCFESMDSRYSFAKLDNYWYVTEVAEKIVISNNATNWLYYFRLWKDFIFHSEKMIERNELSGWEFYVWPLYNDLIKTWKRIKISTVKENWVLWTPEELDYFLKNYNED